MAEIIKIRCRGCQSKLKAPMKYQGRTINCPQCGQEIKIPILKEPAVGTKRAKPQAAVAAAPMLLDDPPPKQQVRTKPKPRPKEEEPIELGDDAFAETGADPWDFDTADYGDYEDFETQPRPKRKKPAPSKKRPAKKRKKPAKSSGGGIYIDPSIWGGLGLMILGAGLFGFAWINGYIWPWAGIISVVGLIGMIKGIFGIGDD